MASDSKQPGMFDAFGPGKSGPSQPKKPSQPPSKPVDIKPPIPVPGRVKPEAQPSGVRITPPKPVVPVLKEAKAIQPKPQETRPPGQKPVESKGVVPELREAKRVQPAASKPSRLEDSLKAPSKVEGPEMPAKPAAAPPASPIAAAPAAPAAPAPKPAPAPAPARPVGTAPAPVLTPGGVKPATSAGAPGAPKPAPSVGPAKDAGGLGGQGDVHVMKFGQKSEVVFGLSYQALIVTLVVAFAAIVVIVLLAVAIAGRGGDTPVTKGDGKSTTETGKSTTETGKSTTETPATEGEFPPGTYYSVQVLTVKNEPERLREIESVKEFLKEYRVGVVVRRVNKRGDLVSLFAGAFLREHKSDAEVLAKRIQGLNYHGRYEFKTAQVVSIQ